MLLISKTHFGFLDADAMGKEEHKRIYNPVGLVYFKKKNLWS